MKMRNNLRILHTESSCGWGGQEIRILNEAAGFIARGHQVELVCSPDSEIASAAERLNIPVHKLPIEKKTLSALRAMRKWLSNNQFRFDLINTHSSTDSWLCALANLTLSASLPIVRTRHVSTPVNSSFTTKWLYRSATKHIVTTGERLRQQLAKQNGFVLKRMTSIPTGVDFKVFHPLEKSECRHKLGISDVGQFTIGIVATLRSWKGHTDLFDALAIINGGIPWQLVVVGDGPYEETLHKKVTSLNLEGQTKFVGRQSNVAEWLNTFDLFCLPSYGEEGVPQSIMQAMSCGVPVISTPIGSISEAVLDGETGILVPARDTARLADALYKLMNDDGLRERMGQASLKYARQTFDMNVMLDKMEHAFYQALVGVKNDE
jgi:glycosyltransferase involved in cell wall biosynthesis